MIRQYPRLGETLYKRRLENGLTVAVVPRPGFTRALCYFVTDFGSVHTSFTLDSQEYTMPPGVAHFLEHKMFELPGRDVTGEFAALGGNVNAFTSYDMTAYYVSCTKNLEENLQLLLEFVATPYFEEESVLREQGIIDQEIGMNADAPENQVFEELARQLYREHPIRVPILGTSQSIREITPRVLDTCHRAFYTPDNMILCVVGDISPDRVCAIAEQVLGTQRLPAGKKQNRWQESMEVSGVTRRQMEVSMPAFQMGFKCESPGTGEAAIRQEVIGDLAAEALFGESSQLYLQLYEQGLIDGSFYGGFETADGCALLTCGGDSDDPEAVRDAILARAQQLQQDFITQEEFLRMKRSALGRRIRDLDSFDSTCFRICAYHFSGFDYFDFPAVYESVALEEIQAFIRRVVTGARCVLSVIDPLSTENHIGGTNNEQ